MRRIPGSSIHDSNQSKQHWYILLLMYHKVQRDKGHIQGMHISNTWITKRARWSLESTKILILLFFPPDYFLTDLKESNNFGFCVVRTIFKGNWASRRETFFIKMTLKTKLNDLKINYQFKKFWTPIEFLQRQF